jgi:hypothetical protein
MFFLSAFLAYLLYDYGLMDHWVPVRSGFHQGSVPLVSTSSIPTFHLCPCLPLDLNTLAPLRYLHSLCGRTRNRILVAKNAKLLVSGVEEAGVLWGADTLAGGKARYFMRTFKDKQLGKTGIT